MSRPEPSLGELFAELTDGVKTLAVQEVRLAKVELSQKGAALAHDMAAVALGASLLYGGFLALLAGLVGALAHLTQLSWWASALILGVVLAVAGAIAAHAGWTKMMKQSLKPEQTLQSLKEDATWAKQQIQS